MQSLCNEIIERKNVVLRDHAAESEQHDELYTSALKKQVSELGMLSSCVVSIDNLLRISSERAQHFWRVLQEELVHVESSLVEQRKTLIENKRAEYDVLVERRRALEM